MLAVNPYLTFNGTCEEAFNFYKSIFGGEFDGGTCIRYKDIPDQNIPQSDKEKVMHVSLPLNPGNFLMGCDASEAFGQITKFGNNITITLCMESEEETHRVYNALSAGGEIGMPPEQTFWAKLYATFTDKFGISWALNYMDLDAPCN